MKSLRPILCAATAALTLATTLQAQIVGGQRETLHRFNGLTGSDHMGAFVSGAGDVDGDGFDDVIACARWGNYVRVYSGRTGLVIWHFSTGYLSGDVADAGDMDGDGVPDLLVGVEGASPGGLSNAGSVFAYSGATGLVLQRFDGMAAGNNLGRSVDGAGDVNSDGVPDVVTGAHMASPGGNVGAGSAFVHSGATGALIWRFDGGATDDHLGQSVSGIDDVDGDGIPDLIIGSLGSDPGGLVDAGSAFLYSGATGALIRRFDGATAGDQFGWSVASAGDVDSDGVPDVVVGAPTASPGGRGDAGSAYVYSGATGSLIWSFDGPSPGDELGYSVCNAGDFDGDGVADLILGAPYASPGGVNASGSVYLFSGATGAAIKRFDGTRANDQLGFSVRNAGDVDGDGLGDVVAGAYGAHVGSMLFAGSTFVYSLAPYLHPSAGTLSVSGGSTVQLGMDFPASEAGARYAVLASITGTGPIVMAGLEIPLTQDNVFDLIISGNVPAPLQGAFGTLNANGQALATLTAGPALAPAVGQTVYFAAVTYDVGPLTGRMSSVVRYLQITP